MATRLCEAGHYAAAQIQQISGQLDQDWKSFASALEERSAILAMSSVFHQKTEQVITGMFDCLLFLRTHLSKLDFRLGWHYANLLNFSDLVFAFGHAYVNLVT